MCKFVGLYLSISRAATRWRDSWAGARRSALARGGGLRAAGPHCAPRA